MAKHISTQLILYLCLVSCAVGQYESSSLSRPSGLPDVVSLEVMCNKDHMTVQLGFAGSFNGLVFSKGQFSAGGCVYVPPNSDQSSYSFQIGYNKCGTKPDLNGKFYENTIIIQYDSELIEVWDEAKRLRCEWYNDYEKTATKAPVVISDLEVIELNFRGDNVDCWMEVQDGKGPWSGAVNGIVPLGSTLTMVVAINDPNDEFDMRVKDCEASDGRGRPIQLSDQNGCVLRPKMVSPFNKLKNNDGRSTVLTYAHFHAFKFPDSVYVHLRCKVEICRYGCPDHCQQIPSSGYPGQRRVDETGPLSDALSDPHHAESNHLYSVNRLGQQMPDRNESDFNNSRTEDSSESDLTNGHLLESHQDLNSIADSMASLSRQLPAPSSLTYRRMPDERMSADQHLSFLSNKNSIDSTNRQETKRNRHRHTVDAGLSDSSLDRSEFPWGPRSLNIRRKRFVVDSENGAAADVGVVSTLQVISPNDLQFESTYDNDKPVTVFQGRISDEQTNKVCLPAAGFSAAFVLLAMTAVVATLVAGFLCQHRQRLEKCQREPEPTGRHKQQMELLRLHQWPVVTFLSQHISS